MSNIGSIFREILTLFSESENCLFFFFPCAKSASVFIKCNTYARFSCKRQRYYLLYRMIQRWKTLLFLFVELLLSRETCVDDILPHRPNINFRFSLILTLFSKLVHSLYWKMSRKLLKDEFNEIIYTLQNKINKYLPICISHIMSLTRFWGFYL